MLSEKEREALFIINRMPGMYYKRLRLMYEYTGSFEEALSVPEKEFISNGVFINPGIPNFFDSYRLNGEFIEESRMLYRSLSSRGISMLDLTEEMPVRLRQMPDPPAVLFVKGELPADKVPSVSIIGARRCSNYGSDAACFFAAELAKCGVQVISGMARGIDTMALNGAVTEGGKGYAVLGSGVEVCYPRESLDVYNAISRGNGGIISEFSPDAAPLNYHFVMRNRLIAALGDVLLVMEAATRSGTQITVQDALSQGKDVFALPGRITDPLGRGCNRLIREGAFPLIEPADVLTYLGIEKKGSARTLKEKVMSGLSEDEKKLLSVMTQYPMHVEEIAIEAGMDLQKSQHLLSMLELHGNIRPEGSAYYSKIYK